nr:unnamed protein product [Callosobruchus analis]
MFMDLLVSSSDSSSSDSDDDTMPRLIPFMLRDQPKNEGYVENTVELYSDIEFLFCFRVTRELAEQLANQLHNSVHYPTTDSGHKRIPALNCILMFLWFDGHEAAGYRDVDDRFNVCISKLHHIMHSVSSFLSNMARSVVTWHGGRKRRSCGQVCKYGVFQCNRLHGWHRF